VRVGDMVKLVGTFSSEKIGLIVCSAEFSPGWHTIICGDDRIHWPESQLEMISENK